jgi:hypothetical protein
MYYLLFSIKVPRCGIVYIRGWEFLLFAVGGIAARAAVGGLTRSHLQDTENTIAAAKRHDELAMKLGRLGYKCRSRVGIIIECQACPRPRQLNWM